MGTCPNCGARRRDDHRFCVSCGWSFDAAPAPAVVEEASAHAAGATPHEHATSSRAEDRLGSAATGAPTEVVALAGGVDLASCPTCGAVNAVERVRCARCSTAMRDLAAADDWPSDDALPLPDDLDAGVGAAPGRGRAGRARGDRSPRGMGLAIVVIGAIVGAVLATWAVGLGPFARTAGPGVDFDGEVYAGQASPLGPASVTTSPVREAGDGRAFTADLAVDGRLDTAWVAVDGADATLEVAFDQPVWITALEVANGDQYDEESFAATARIRILGIDAGLGSRVEATLISGPGRQGFRPPTPLLTDRVLLDVVTTTEGEDVALSDVTFVGFVADPDDARDYAEAVG